MMIQNGRFHIDMEPDGAVHVHSGDSLSMYSAAIYCRAGAAPDFSHVGEFARMNTDNALETIRDVNRIKAGETIYHRPTYEKYHPQPTRAVIRWGAAALAGVAQDIARAMAVRTPDLDLLRDLRNWQLTLFQFQRTHQLPFQGMHGGLHERPDFLSRSKAPLSRGEPVTIIDMDTPYTPDTLEGGPAWWYAANDSGVTGFLHVHGLIRRFVFLSDRPGGEGDDVSPDEVEIGGRG